MRIKEVLGVDIPRELLPLKAGVTYYELMQLWTFEKSNHFKEARELFLKKGKKIDFKEANKIKGRK